MVRTIAATAITVVSLVLLGVQFASMTVDSGVLPSFAPHGACSLTLGEIVSGSGVPAIRSGDAVDQSALPSAARIFLASGSVRAGGPIALPIVRDGRSSVVQLATSPQPSWSFWFFAILSKVIVYGVGALVLWRGRDLAAFFFGISSLAIAVAVHPEPSSWLQPDMQVWYTIVARLSADVAAFFLYLMVERLSGQALSRGWLAVARTAVVGGLATDAISTVFYVRDVAGGVCASSALAAIVTIPFMVVLVATLAVLSAAYFASSGTARQRLKWISASTIVGFSGVLIYLGAQIIGRPITSYPIMNITMIAIPVGYSYAILRHRVIDVGFAINRAIVFTAITTVVVIVFALLSGVIERAAVGSSTGLALQVAVALALALSFNALQKRVETAIDRIFFRRKHRAQAELARAADEAPFVTRAQILLDRAADIVRSELGACASAVYLADADGSYRRWSASGEDLAPNVPIDDPAFVRLRTYLRDIDLTDVDSVLGRSGCIFPLAAHGRLMGALVCGDRRSEEPYDPDERSAIRSLAARVSSALEGLRAREFGLLVRQLAEGALDADQARARARSLIADL
ncbi:MAG TPA: GAF domain-containing protein [Candidatus Eremiobacteraceae bacterium]|nr:GAF domain-containing protein [Candidatus Eremiobacteraceae bacterium]